MTRHERFIEFVSSLPESIRWALTDQAVVRSLTFGLPVQRSARSQLIRWFLLVCLFDRVRWALVRFLAARIAPGRSEAVPVADMPVRRILMGFGAGAESSLFKTDIQQQGTIYIDQTDYSGEHLRYLGKQQVRDEIFRQLPEIGDAIQNLPLEFL